MRRLIAASLLLLAAVGCEREERRFREPPGATQRSSTKRLVSLVPGPYTADVRAKSPYFRNAFGVSEGKRLFRAYNCEGCHANGGGGMGPPLMDDHWIYGSDPENIFATIVEGRPNGMPSFKGKMPDYQVWQLVAYVESLSGNVPKDVANGRPDEMQVHTQDQSLPDLQRTAQPARHP
ncbi:MAG: cytochrome c class [Acidobacteria bacterium]|nr:cytochrome c class [Acidobacteriota bacterium]